MRRILSAIVTVLGLVAIALAVCSATLWKPSSTVEASLAQSPSQPYVVTEPGVLGTVGSDVTVTATAEGGQEVRVIVARATDVQAWLATDPYVSVTGLSADASTLESTEVTEKCEAEAAEPADASGQDAQGGCTPREPSGVNPADSDLWITEHTGSGSVTFEQSAADGQIVVMAVTDGTASAPSLTLSWPRTVETPWYFYAGLVLGGLLVLVGVFLFLIDIQMRHADAQRRTRAAERAARVARADGVATASIPQLDDPDRQLTRRELRDKERAERMGEEWIDPRTGRVHRGGVEAPDVPAAPAGLPEPGAQGAPWQPTDSRGRTDGEVGAARGAAVVPGLDEATTQAHRATRDLGGQPAFSVSPTGGMDASTAEVPAYQDEIHGAPPAGSGDGQDRSGQAAPWAGPDRGAGMHAASEADPSAAQAFSGPQGHDGADPWQQGGAQGWGQQVPASWGQDLGHQGLAEPAAPAGPAFPQGAAAEPGWEQPRPDQHDLPHWAGQAPQNWGDQAQQDWAGQAPQATAGPTAPAAFEAPFSGSDHATPARPGLAVPEQPSAPAHPEAPVTPSVPAMPGTAQDAWAGPGGQAGPGWPAADLAAPAGPAGGQEPSGLGAPSAEQPAPGGPVPAAPSNPYLGAAPAAGGPAAAAAPAGPIQQGAVPDPQAGRPTPSPEAPRTPAAPLGSAEAGAQVEDYRVSEEEIRAANAVPLSATNPTHEERP
ncbi:hypothetical protein [Actinomyces bowdenii]|uniref:Uncharacterized protein n=1 Tax=Actinomyces bowdenii TaxID=131109 RepID=A0A3P1V866_9ACTO|nr:hypothetical protein [Actinomyces bowdenii]RRD30394.1 hypothetical protein EII10_03035 [Actinomyces bowdenii]